MSKSDKIIELDANNTCQLCDNALAKYSCPKCQLSYCSLVCYRSERHLECSEEFYKNCIREELVGEASDSSKQKMLDILSNQRGEDHDEDQFDSHSDEGNDSDDFDLEELSKRMSGIDLDNADQVWDKLTDDERQEFLAFVKSGDVSKLLPKWLPWWSLESTRKVEEVETSEGSNDKYPKVVDILNFSDICTKEPAASVKFNLINVIAAYVFTMRYFHGEIDEFVKEFVSTVISIATTLKTNENFQDFDTAVKSVEYQCTQSEWIMADCENFAVLRDDVSAILTGPKFKSDKLYYITCALSHLSTIFAHSLTVESRTNDIKDSKFGNFCNAQLAMPNCDISKRQIKNCRKKFDYFLAYCHSKYYK